MGIPSMIEFERNNRKFKDIWAFFLYALFIITIFAILINVNRQNANYELLFYEDNLASMMCSFMFNVVQFVVFPLFFGLAPRNSIIFICVFNQLVPFVVEYSSFEKYQFRNIWLWFFQLLIFFATQVDVSACIIVIL